MIAFDFDQTIVAENTDLVVMQLLLGHPDLMQSVNLDEIYREHGWTAHMQAVFQLLHDARIPPASIREIIRKMDALPGMLELIQHLHDDNFDFEIIIISDANSLFIDEWCRSHGIANLITRVFTNPAEFKMASTNKTNSTEMLHIRPYHSQTDCTLSSSNLCKGHVLDTYINDRRHIDGVTYRRVFYVGDGKNDVCPILRLSAANGFGCARIGFSLDKELIRIANGLSTFVTDEHRRLVATVIRWENGIDLLESIKKAVL